MIFITAADVAPIIGFATAQQFLAHRARLEADTDFPLPMPTSRRPLKWRRDAVEHWAVQQGLAASLPIETPTPADNVVLLQMAGQP